MNIEGTEPDGLPEPARTWAIVTTALGLMMAVLDGSIANLALPTLAAEFNVSASQSIWVVNAYQLAVTISLLPLAALGEIVGYRRVYRIGVALFTVASLACAMSHSLTELTIARVAQGFGAAGLMSVNSALVRFIYPRALLGRGFGVNVMVGSASSALGPSVAAAILSVAGWQWLFAVNVPLGALILILGAKTLPFTPRASHRFDWGSAALNALTFGLFISGIEAFGHGGSPVYAVLELLAGLAAGLPASQAAGLSLQSAAPGRSTAAAHLRVVGRGVDVLVRRAEHGVRDAALLSRARAGVRPGRNRAADDALAGDGDAGGARSRDGWRTASRPGCWAGLGRR